MASIDPATDYVAWYHAASNRTILHRRIGGGHLWTGVDQGSTIFQVDLERTIGTARYVELIERL